MTNEELVGKLVHLVQQEKRVTVEVIKHLREVEKRGAHLAMGYSSLFEFGMKHLRYSEGEIVRRLKAMRLMKQAPEVEHMIANGEMSVTVAATAQSFIERTGQKAKDVLAQVRGKSSRAAEKSLFSLLPEPVLEERTRVASARLNEIILYIDDETLDRLGELKTRLSLKSYSEVVQNLARRSPSAPKVIRVRKAAKISRQPSAHVRRQVWRRDQGQCTYVDLKTGRRCEARHLLEFDHIIPWSKGGPTTYHNLRILCRAHNQFRLRSD